MGSLGQKLFFFKKMPKMNLQEQISCSVQKTAGKKSQYSRNKTILKFHDFGKSIGHAKWALWVKNCFLQKYAENESTRTIKLFCAKNGWKNSQYSRNETILKIDHFGKSIAHAKWVLWVKYFFSLKIGRK